jgi:hypothetical protein
MCHCITPQALLQGLVRRVEGEAYEPTTSDVRALVGAGCATAELRAMVARMDAPAAERLGAAIERAFPVDRYRRG